MISRWIADDPDHRKKGMVPGFFLEARTLGLMFEDHCGPVFAVRLDPETGGTVRIHIQFDATQLLRTARGLAEGFLIVKDRAEVAGAKRLVFDSVYAPLIDFCQRRFGFQPVEGTNDLELALP